MLKLAPNDTANDDMLETPLNAYIGYNLKRAMSIIHSDLARVLSVHNLRAVSFSALTIIVEKQGLNQTELAESLQIERSNLVTILDELAARGLILRTPVAHDRRRHALMATPAGKALASAAGLDVTLHEQQLFSSLTEQERLALGRILQKFRRANKSQL